MNKFLLVQPYAENTQENNVEVLITYALIAFIVILISAFITRAIFSIPKILKYYKANTLLMVKIARQQGVSEVEIDNILDIIDEREKPVVYPDYGIRKIDKIHLHKNN